MIMNDMMWAAAGSGDSIGQILAALFPPVAMAAVFVFIGWTALRNTDWKKQQDHHKTQEQRSVTDVPRDPGVSP